MFLREIRDPRLRLVRAREILARRVDRRHAPGLLEGGDGGDGARGAAHVFDYVADDAVRAIKALQQSEGSGDYAVAAAALGAVASAAAYGVACAQSKDDGLAASRRGVDGVRRRDASKRRVRSRRRRIARVRGRICRVNVVLNVKNVNE